MTATVHGRSGNHLRDAARRMLMVVWCVLACCYCQAEPRQAAAQQAAAPVGPSIEFTLQQDQLELLAKPGAVDLVVGYFPAERSTEEPLFSYRVPGGDVIRTPQGAARVPLYHWQAPAGRTQVVVRIRTVTRAGASDWSAPTPPLAVEQLATLPHAPTPPPSVKPNGPKAPAKRSAPANKKAPAAKIPGPLRTNVALKSAIERQFPKVNVSEAAVGFPNVSQFVASLCAATNLGIPFDEMKPLTATRRKNALEEAVRKLRPKVDAAAETKKAHAQARDIIRGARQ